MKKQTAVEWIEDIINKSFTDKAMIEIFASILNKAKEIEKEQLEEAWDNESLNDYISFREYYDYRYGDIKKVDKDTKEILSNHYPNQ